MAQLVAYTSGGRGVGGSSPPSPNMKDINAQKVLLRKVIQGRLGELPRERFKTAGVPLMNDIKSLDRWKPENWLVGFCSTIHEVETKFILKAALKDGLNVALPKVEGDYLTFHRITMLKQLIRGYRGILEPQALSPKLDLSVIDTSIIFLIPGVAFDLFGRRLGSGKGYYDKAIKSFRQLSNNNLLIGVCIEEQIVDSVPIIFYDEFVDRIYYY